MGGQLAKFLSSTSQLTYPAQFCFVRIAWWRPASMGVRAIGENYATRGRAQKTSISRRAGSPRARPRRPASTPSAAHPAVEEHHRRACALLDDLHAAPQRRPECYCSRHSVVLAILLLIGASQLLRPHFGSAVVAAHRLR